VRCARRARLLPRRTGKQPPEQPRRRSRFDRSPIRGCVYTLDRSAERLPFAFHLQAVMTSPDPTPTFSLVGQMLRTPEEIARVLNSLVMRGEPIVADLGGGKLLFRSRLRFVDPARAYMIIELSPDDAANKALLARPRATFHAEPGGWRV